MLPTKLRVSWLWVEEQKPKKGFQDGGHLEFPIGTILAILDKQVIPIFPTRFQVNWPFSSLGDVNRLLRWRSWQPACIFNPNDYSCFWSTSHPDASYQVSSQYAFWFMKKNLGVTIFSNNKWSNHIDSIINSASKQISSQKTKVSTTKTHP